MDIERCEKLESVHKEATNVFQTYGAAMNKYCPKNFDDFFLQGDAQGDFGSDGFVTNYFILEKCKGDLCHP